MFAKKNGRVSYRSNRRSNYKKNTNLFLSNKPRAKGNISQLHEKYSKLAKEASSSGDRIQAEYYYQFADHYSRLMIEFGLKSFNNTDSSESVDEKILQNEEQNEEQQNEEQIDQSTEKNISMNENKNNKSENIIENSSESIGEVSFIAEPAKKTSSKVKKGSS